MLMTSDAPVALLGAATASPSPTPGPVEETAEAVVSTGATLLSAVLHAGAGALAGLVAAVAVGLVMSVMGRRAPLWRQLHHYCRLPLHATGTLAGVWVGALAFILGRSDLDQGQLVMRLLLAAVVVAATWTVSRAAKAIEATVVEAVENDGDLNRLSRVTTQAQVLRRVAQAVIAVCGVAGAAMVFPSARVAMASLLASAGLVSVIAGLAAQTTLANVFAGLQLAVSDAIRVGDVVLVEDKQGRIEEITLTYVVVHVWDDRRIIYPSKFFTETPFTNLSRRGTQLTGTLDLELDFRVPVARLREHLEQVVPACPQWDGREVGLQVADAVGGVVTVRVVVSAAGTADLFTLKCHVREELLAWLQDQAPQALPRTRVVLDQAPTP